MNIIKNKVRFNKILMIILAVGLICGCSSQKNASSTKKNAQKNTKSGLKEATRISFHIEINPDGTDRCVQAQIYRKNPMTITVDRSPVLHEGFVERADVVEFMGTYAIRIKFDSTGTLLLDNATTSNKGRRMAIFAQFSDARWIGAPVINQRIANGVFIFTPDTTKEEAERIVRGLNNVANAVQPKKKK